MLHMQNPWWMLDSTVIDKKWLLCFFCFVFYHGYYMDNILPITDFFPLSYKFQALILEDFFAFLYDCFFFNKARCPKVAADNYFHIKMKHEEDSLVLWVSISNFNFIAIIYYFGRKVKQLKDFDWVKLKNFEYLLCLFSSLLVPQWKEFNKNSVYNLHTY